MPNERVSELVRSAKQHAIDSASKLREAATLLDGSNPDLAGQLRSSAKTIRNAAKRFGG